MNNLPLFDTPKQIHTSFNTNAEIILYAGDTNDFIQTIPDESIKVIITSPPYNLGKEYENRWYLFL